MTDIDRIEKDVSLQMDLSEVLFKALGMGCWHEWKYVCTVHHNPSPHRDDCKWRCKCGEEIIRSVTPSVNPNLFTRSAFLNVFDAVKDNSKANGWMFNIGRFSEVVIEVNDVVSPGFQLEILKRLNKEGLEKVLSENR